MGYSNAETGGGGGVEKGAGEGGDGGVGGGDYGGDGIEGGWKGSARGGEEDGRYKWPAMGKNISR